MAAVRRRSASRCDSRIRRPTPISPSRRCSWRDGIENKLDPGDPIDKNLYDLPPEELEKVPTVCGSLREACESLDADRAFLKKGNVFTDDAIDAYLELKMEEVERFEMMPHPVEFDMYYSV